MLADKLGIGLEWEDKEWSGSYYLTDKVVDAAVLSVDVLTPDSNTSYTIGSQFNLTANISVLGVGVTGCNASLNKTNDCCANLSANQQPVHHFNLSVGNSTLETWELNAFCRCFYLK